jgi:hypothetical protein
MKKNFIILICSLLTMICLMSATNKKDDPKTANQGNLILHFNNMVNGAALKLNDTAAVYQNANGDSYTITTFKYYVSNVVLTDEGGKATNLPDSYYLINAADSLSLNPQINNIPAGKYKAISFTIGVDSARNFAGAQTGALDPAHGMFWSWNSGYIFLKMEGESAQSKAKLHKLTFHIGGVKQPHNTIRAFSQTLDEPLVIAANKTAEMNIETNAAALFKGKTTIDFSKLSFTMGGANSVLVADNYNDGLFKITHVKN